MARNFVRSSSHYIRTTVGNLATLRYGTLAAIIKRGSDPGPAAYVVAAIVDSSNTGGGTGGLIRVTSDGQIGVQFGGTLIDSGTGLGLFNNTDWHLIVATKATGNVAPRFHSYNFATHTWVHTTSGSTMGDSGATSTRMFIGTVHDPLFDAWDGDMAILGAWKRALSDAEIELLPFSLIPWLMTAPDGLWLLDQSETSQSVRDLTGGGADQAAISGTTVSINSVPLLSYGHSPLYAMTNSGIVVVTAVAPPVGMQIIG